MTFYKLWLDEQLVYTCAYYPSADTSLEAAQIAKLDHVCRKLDLKPGETVVEAGCGWGALALHMARNYGVNVRAYNVSSEQVRYARERAHAAHLDNHVEFVQDDWRNIIGQADAFVSVGMLEHVGPEKSPCRERWLPNVSPGRGRGLIHTIGQNFPSLNPWIEEKIFPGAQPRHRARSSSIWPAGELIVLDVENLRLHYAETLRHWLYKPESSLDQIRAMHDETFIRAWRMYLASSCSAFATGGLQLYQMLFAPGASNAIPRTREHQYRDLNASHHNGSLTSSRTGGQLERIDRRKRLCGIPRCPHRRRGPAGSSRAWQLRKYGYDAVVMDKSNFPRDTSARAGSSRRSSNRWSSTPPTTLGPALCSRSRASSSRSTGEVPQRPSALIKSSAMEFVAVNSTIICSAAAERA
ncbi:MAG: class I SAM-dependent methyltransferase [Planctomycetales bacterium]